MKGSDFIVVHLFQEEIGSDSELPSGGFIFLLESVDVCGVGVPP